MLRRRFAWVLVAMCAGACTDAGPAEPEGSLSAFARIYLDSAVTVMELNSVKRYEIDWPAFREQTLADAAGAQTISETYPVIVDALERIGDHHSFFRPPITSPPETSGPDPSASLIGEVGYLDVPEFSGGGPDGHVLAQEYHDLIEGVDTLAPICRWVVDLRGNTGGNMWPMVAGVGPILGEDTVGFFVDPDSLVQTWIYGDGAATLDGATIAGASAPYTLESPYPHVAVLTDSLTASSGEAVAVAFTGRTDTRSFGAPTWGVSTANAAFPLADGAVIFLTVTTMADRSGMIYGGELVPDEPISGGAKTGDPETDDALGAAIEWLEARACG